METTANWFIWALLSAIFAALTAIFAKIGLKMVNDYHIPSLLGLADVQVVAVCDVDRSRRLHAKDRVDNASIHQM